MTKLTDCGVKSWKELARNYLKGVQSWHFKFSTARRISIEKSGDIIKVRGEEHYNSNIGEAKSIFKRGKRGAQMEVADIQKGVALNEKKVEDVSKLLTSHFGENWVNREDLKFFKNFLEEQSRGSLEEEIETNEFCEGGLEEDISPKI